jgi:hypothetical protein
MKYLMLLITKKMNILIRYVIFLTRGLRYWWDKKSFTQNKLIINEFLDRQYNKYKGKPLLMVGNGPSLNETPLEKFREINSIGMNKINILFDRTTWRPDVIVCTNNLVARQNKSFYLSSKIPILLSWKCRWFINSKINDNIKYFLSLPVRKFSKNLVHGVGSSGTVTYSALQLAYYLGCNPVIIVGVDHSFAVTGPSNEIATMKVKDTSHFDPNYFQKGQKWGLPNLEASEDGYRQAMVAFNDDDRQIYDATINGKLQIFPKITITRALEICNKGM